MPSCQTHIHTVRQKQIGTGCKKETAGELCYMEHTQTRTHTKRLLLIVSIYTVYHSTSSFSIMSSALCTLRTKKTNKKNNRNPHSVSRIVASSDLLFNQSMSYKVLPSKTLLASFQCGDAALHNVLGSVLWRKYGGTRPEEMSMKKQTHQPKVILQLGFRMKI